MPMRLRHTIGLSLALLAISGSAAIKPALADDNSQRVKKQHVTDVKLKVKPRPTTKLAQQRRPATRPKPMINLPLHVAAPAKPPVHPALHVAAPAKPLVHPVVHASARIKPPVRPPQHVAARAKPLDRVADGRPMIRPIIHVVARQPVAHDRPAAERAVPEDRLISQVRPIGARQVGSASWYGGSHIGRLTASGVPLDTVHNTAAHRSLPLQSLARVTNLKNGRCIIVRVTDRGPVSERFVIDLSPSAARELDMVEAGVVPVVVEPVAMVEAHN
jgi:rare lipoprotein A